MVEEYSTIDKHMESIRKKNKIIEHDLSIYINKLHRKYAERTGRVDHMIKETKSVLDSIQTDQMKFRTKSYKFRVKVTNFDDLKENSESEKSQPRTNKEDENEDDVFTLEESKCVSESQLSISSVQLCLNPGWEKCQDTASNPANTSLSDTNGYKTQTSQRNSRLYTGNRIENVNNKQQKQMIQSKKEIKTPRLNLNTNSYHHSNLPKSYMNHICNNNASTGSKSESRESIKWNSCMSRGHAPNRQIPVTPKYNGRLSSGSLGSASEDSFNTDEGGTSKKKKKNARLRLPPVVPSIIHRLREMDKQRVFISALKILD